MLRTPSCHEVINMATMAQFVFVFVAILFSGPAAARSIQENLKELEGMEGIGNLDLQRQEEQYSEIAEQFRAFGCNEYDVRLVAELEAVDEQIFVAWCATFENYLMELRCRIGFC